MVLKVLNDGTPFKKFKTSDSLAQQENDTRWLLLLQLLSKKNGSPYRSNYYHIGS